VKTILRQKIFYNVKSQKISKDALYYAKHGVSLHSGSLRKFFFYFTVRIVVSALVTIPIVLVSIYKQYCAVFSAK
jgi:tetrahydromethanopterin S-methyltransferase subunit B